MVYYCNYSVIGCCEEMLKGLKYVKKDKYYNVSNGLGLDENKFKGILERFEDCRLMVFISLPYDESIYLGISDIGSKELDEEIRLCSFDYSDEELFINEVYPTDSFIFKQIDGQTGMLLTLDYENPYIKWWSGEMSYKKGFNKKLLKAKEGYGYSKKTVLGIQMKLPKLDSSLDENEIIKSINNQISLNCFPDSIKDNEKIVEIAVKNKAEELKFASDRIKNDKDFIMEMYRYHEKRFNEEVIISNIGKNLKNDKYFFEPLVKERPSLYRYIGSKLKQDLNFLLVASGGMSYASTKIINKINTDREYALNAVKKGLSYSYLPNEFQNEREFALESVKKNGGNYVILPINFRMDKEITLIALKTRKEVVKYSVPNKLKNDLDIKMYL